MQGWGRWGPDDELGSLNLIGAEEVRRGLAEVRDGTVIPLAAPVVANRGFAVVGRAAPQHYMVRDGGDYAAGLPERAGFGFADDVITLPVHGVTHVDALAHVWRDGQMYNGHKSTEVTSRGARKLGIDKMRPIVTRGVLVDSRPGGVRPAGEPIHCDELVALVADQGVHLLPGDALLIRTGWIEGYAAALTDASEWAGLDRDCASWLADQQVSLLGSDNVGVESYPSADPDCQVPLHIDLLRGHGIHFCELMNLSELAAAQRSTFLFVLSPLPFVGAVGSPVAPVAVL